jgi:hypothetical protein
MVNIIWSALSPPGTKAGVRGMKNTEEIWSLVDAKERPFTQLSDRVWGMPELCYGEFGSCAAAQRSSGRDSG